jgi:hypothetical protein
LKPLTPGEQFQLQLDVQNLKVACEEMKKEVEVLSGIYQQLRNGILSISTSVESHHELLKIVVEKINGSNGKV